MSAATQLDGANGSVPRFPEANPHYHGLVDIGRQALSRSKRSSFSLGPSVARKLLGTS
jgi:hypothetical protein